MAMWVEKVVPLPDPDYDPYEEDCCGSHPAESFLIHCKDGIDIKVQRQASGIGDAFYVEINGQRVACAYYSDDDGSLVVEGYIHDL